MLDALLSVLRPLADALEGTPAAAEAQADVKSVEAIAAKHAAALEADVRNWLTARLHPSLPQEG